MKNRLFIFALAAALASQSVMAQTAPPATTTPPAQAQEKKEPEKKDERTAEQKKYDELLKTAKSQPGVFKVHKVDDKVYWEIPVSKFGREFLFQSEVSELPRAIGYVGTSAGTRVIRFTRRGNRVQIRSVLSDTRAVGNDKGVILGVEKNSTEPILLTFDQYAEGPEKSVVIDVTSWFNSDPQDFSVRSVIGQTAGVDSTKSYVDKVKAFPTNIETRSLLTFRMAGRGSGGGLAALFGGGGGWNASTASVVAHYSLVELPEKPLQGRLKDSRIGYFTNSHVEFGREDSASKVVEYISRFRLEKKDPDASVSEPVKPIVFYLAREVPERWRKYLKQGIEDWQPAFEKAGFKNAIIAKDAPTVEEDPDWDAEDARYSVIRWAPSEVVNAMGPSIQDPRSGETISAHIIFWNDIVKLGEAFYYPQTAAIDPAASKLPFSDELMGRLLRYVACHEVGHTLGLEHNFRASVAYSIKQLRDPKFTSENNTAASIMSYSRFNYVAQPGDGVTNTGGRLGPYDFFAIEYGYKQLNAGSPEGEKAALDALLAKQITDKTLRFGNYKYSGIDPTTLSENIGDDAVEATRLGLLNLERICRDHLIPSASKFGESWDKLEELHSSVIGQWVTEIMHVAAQVGGVVEEDQHVGRGDGIVFKPVAKERQAAAVKLLTERGLRPSSAVFNARILKKITPQPVADQLAGVQGMILRSLLSDAKVKRLQDFEDQQPGKAYTVANLVSDLSNGVFAELDAAKVTVPLASRNLHRTYLKQVDGRVNGASATATDLKPLLKESLRAVAQKIDKALPKAADKLTAAHLAEVRSDIVKILNDTYTKPGGSSAPSFSLLDLLGGFGFNTSDQANCWRRAIPAALLELQKELEAEKKASSK